MHFWEHNSGLHENNCPRPNASTLQIIKCPQSRHRFPRDAEKTNGVRLSWGLVQSLLFSLTTRELKPRNVADVTLQLPCQLARIFPEHSPRAFHVFLITHPVSSHSFKRLQKLLLFSIFNLRPDRQNANALPICGRAATRGLFPRLFFLQGLASNSPRPLITRATSLIFGFEPDRFRTTSKPRSNRRFRKNSSSANPKPAAAGSFFVR